MNKLLVLLAAGLPACVLASDAGAHLPSFSCSSSPIEAYAPGSWRCGGDLTLSGGEVESGLFALQAAIGAGILGFVLGTFRERRKRSTETAPNADDSPQNAARTPESTTRSS